MKKWIFLIALTMIFTNVKAEYKVEYHYVKDVKDYQEVKNFKVNTNKQVTLVYEKERLQEVPKESPKIKEKPKELPKVEQPKEKPKITPKETPKKEVPNTSDSSNFLFFLGLGAVSLLLVKNKKLFVILIGLSLTTVNASENIKPSEVKIYQFNEEVDINQFQIKGYQLIGMKIKNLNQTHFTDEKGTKILESENQLVQSKQIDSWTFIKTEVLENGDYKHIYKQIIPAMKLTNPKVKAMKLKPAKKKLVIEDKFYPTKVIGSGTPNAKVSCRLVNGEIVKEVTSTIQKDGKWEVENIDLNTFDVTKNIDVSCKQEDEPSVDIPIYTPEKEVFKVKEVLTHYKDCPDNDFGCFTYPDNSLDLFKKYLVATEDRFVLETHEIDNVSVNKTYLNPFYEKLGNLTEGYEGIYMWEYEELLRKNDYLMIVGREADTEIIERPFIKTFFDYNEEFYVPRQNETKTIQSMRNKKVVLENGKLVIYHYNNIISRSIMHMFT